MDPSIFIDGKNIFEEIVTHEQQRIKSLRDVLTHMPEFHEFLKNDGIKAYQEIIGELYETFHKSLGSEKMKEMSSKMSTKFTAIADDTDSNTQTVTFSVTDTHHVTTKPLDPQRIDYRKSALKF